MVIFSQATFYFVVYQHFKHFFLQFSCFIIGITLGNEYFDLWCGEVVRISPDDRSKLSEWFI